LRAFPALIIVPCLQLCWTLFGVICGMLYFQEYRGMTELQVAMFVLGVGVVCVGAAMLASTLRAGDSAAAAAAAAGAHEHAEAEVVLTPLQPLNGKCTSSLAAAAGDGGSCQLVVWPNNSSSAQSTGGALLQPAGHSMPLIFSYVPPSAAAQPVGAFFCGWVRGVRTWTDRAVFVCCRACCHRKPRWTLASRST
jgi:hypothetical protein